MDRQLMLKIIEILGIVAFTFSGVIEAQRKKMDLIGIFAVAFVTSFGGGTLRDIILNRRPLYWIAKEEYVLLVLLLSVGSAVILRFSKFKITEQAIVIPDALGLGLFSATGSAYAMNLGITPFLSVFIGIISATFGGVLRDIICNEVPIIFRRGQLYATCSLFASVSYVVLRIYVHDYWLAVIASVFVASSLRLLAVRLNIQLPF